MTVTFLHQRLRQKRREKHLTQEMLAEQCDCSVRYLRDLETGVKGNPSAVLLFHIVCALGVSPEELISVEQTQQDSGCS